MEKKAEFLKNVSFDNDRVIRIDLNPMIYPKNVVLRASYSFTEEFDVAVDGEMSGIFVIIKAKDKISEKDFEEIVFAFYGELIHASVEETQAKRYADTRNALIGAALKSIIPVNHFKDMNTEGTENNKNKDVQ